MTQIVLKWEGDGIARITAALDGLVEGRARQALRRAVNHTGDKTYTATRRALAEQMGISAQKLLSQGRYLRKRLATDASLTYNIESSGKAIRAKEFRHNIGKKGITFYPWNRRLNVKSAFVINKYGGNFYVRKGAARFPIHALYGPNLNKELVKDTVAAQFHRIVNRDLPARVAHEVAFATRGVFT